jgi:hypothetical protein
MFIIMQHIALGIVVEILFVRNEQKDWNGKPDPIGERPNYILENFVICIFLLYSNLCCLMDVRIEIEVLFLQKLVLDFEYPKLNEFFV